MAAERQFSDFCELLPAEAAAMESSQAGDFLKVSTLNWRDEKDLLLLRTDSAFRLRGSFIRFLVLGGGGGTHEKGVKIKGAYIVGGLDLEGCEVSGPIALWDCYLDGRLDITDAQTRMLDLGGTRVAGIRGRRAYVRGGLYLQDGFHSDGQVRISGATIEGDTSFAVGTFIDLRSEPGLQYGHAEKEAIAAINMENTRVTGTLILGPLAHPFDKQAVIRGSLNVQGASARGLIDHPGSWPDEIVTTNEGEALKCTMRLDGFVYESFEGKGVYDIETRKRWLLRQPSRHLGRTLRAQPFEQLATTYRKMGHEDEAREVRRFKQEIMLAGRVHRARGYQKPFVWLGWRLFGALAGYGYRPQRTLIWLAALWVLSALAFGAAAERGKFIPADPQIWLDERFALCSPPKGNWANCPHLPSSLNFSAFGYSADNIQPVFDLGIKKNWSPLHENILVTLPRIGEVEFPSWTLTAIVWFELIFGTILWLVLAATASGALLPR